jgi:hypothetical protein
MLKNTIAARAVKGKEGFPRAELTRHEIALLEEMHRSGMTAREIAARFA